MNGPGSAMHRFALHRVQGTSLDGGGAALKVIAATQNKPLLLSAKTIKKFCDRFDSL